MMMMMMTSNIEYLSCLRSAVTSLFRALATTFDYALISSIIVVIISDADNGWLQIEVMMIPIVIPDNYDHQCH